MQLLYVLRHSVSKGRWSVSADSARCGLNASDLCSWSRLLLNGLVDFLIGGVKDRTRLLLRDLLKLIESKLDQVRLDF